MLLGLFSIQRDVADKEAGRPKTNEVCIGFSRDGFHWDRPDRRSFLPVSERSDDWNWGNVQSVGGGCAVVGDELFFYASGRKGNAPHFQDAGGSTGLAILRRDGFASMDAGADEGVLVTRPVRFNGRHLFVNVDCDSGELLTEILDENGDVIARFSREHSERIQADKTICQVHWAGGRDLSGLAG